MPNNPGRIDGDYRFQKEEIKYAQPRAGFGQIRKNRSKNSYLILFTAVIVIVLMFLIAIG